VQISVMEQQYQAVMAVVQDGWKASGVGQSMHKWIGRYGSSGGLGALADPRRLSKAVPFT
jgi:hypothetical protein